MCVYGGSWFFHSADDNVVAVGDTERLVDALRTAQSSKMKSQAEGGAAAVPEPPRFTRYESSAEYPCPQGKPPTAL